MAEPLKNFFGPDVPARVADMIAAVLPDFDREAFLEVALHGLEELELTPRARQVSRALAGVLPKDRDRAIRTLIDALHTEIGSKRLVGMASFQFLPFVFFIAEEGLDCFEKAPRQPSGRAASLGSGTSRLGLGGRIPVPRHTRCC